MSRSSALNSVSLATVVAAMVVAGCNSNSAARFTPPATVAHDALDKALSRWARGRRDSFTAGEKTAVEVIDRQRPIGQSLKKYRILGEVSGDGGRWFEVELTLENPDEVVRDRYVIVGIDPLWVFRQSDYEMLQHWDHPMPSDASAQTAVPAPPTAENGNQPLAGPSS